jgi:hypothetical protein
VDIPIVSVVWSVTRALARWWQSLYSRSLVVVSIPGQRTDEGRGWFEAKLYLDGNRALSIEGAALQLRVGKHDRVVSLIVVPAKGLGEPLREGQPVILAATIPVDLPWEGGGIGPAHRQRPSRIQRPHVAALVRREPRAYPRRTYSGRMATRQHTRFGTAPRSLGERPPRVPPACHLIRVEGLCDGNGLSHLQHRVCGRSVGQRPGGRAGESAVTGARLGESAGRWLSCCRVVRRERGSP